MWEITQSRLISKEKQCVCKPAARTDTCFVSEGWSAKEVRSTGSKELLLKWATLKPSILAALRETGLNFAADDPTEEDNETAMLEAIAIRNCANQSLPE